MKAKTINAEPHSGVEAGRGKPSSKENFKSDAFEAIHSAASALHAAGGIDKTTMRQFDVACLSVREITAADVKRIRAASNVSQEVFARYLGTNKSTVQKWESAGNRPSTMAQRMLQAVDKHGLDIFE